VWRTVTPNSGNVKGLWVGLQVGRRQNVSAGTRSIAVQMDAEVAASPRMQNEECRVTNIEAAESLVFTFYILRFTSYAGCVVQQPA
jgi:hypothetical protein